MKQMVHIPPFGCFSYSGRRNDCLDYFPTKKGAGLKNQLLDVYFHGHIAEWKASLYHK